MPTNIELPQEGFEERGAFLLENGFEQSFIDDLQKTHPKLFSIEHMETRFEDLKARGFDNPQKMITSAPPILGLSIDNIDQKLEILKKLQSQFDLPLKPQEIIEKNLPILGTKIDKIWTLIRVLATYTERADKVDFSLINKLLFSKLDYVVLADVELTEEGQEKTLPNLWSKVKEIKQKKVSKTYAHSKIETFEDKTSEGSEEEKQSGKIARRYRRGYIK